MVDCLNRWPKYNSYKDIIAIKSYEKSNNRCRRIHWKQSGEGCVRSDAGGGGSGYR